MTAKKKPYSGVQIRRRHDRGGRWEVRWRDANQAQRRKTFSTKETADAHATTLRRERKEKGAQGLGGVDAGSLRDFHTLQSSLNGATIAQVLAVCGTAFVFELTNGFRSAGKNTLVVKADNTWRDDVGPISGDFGLPGGIYSPVHLFEKPVVCLGSVRGDEGVKVVQTKASGETGEIAVTAHVDNGGTTTAATVRFELRDAAGKIVTEKSVKIEAAAGVRDVAEKLAINSPRQWNGLAEPHRFSFAWRSR